MPGPGVKERERAMKQGNALVNFVMIALAVALACYLGIYAWDSFNDPYSTTYAYQFYAVINGVEYTSAVQTFTTK